MTKTPSPEELEQFIEMYQRRRSIIKEHEAEKIRQQNSDIYGTFAKYQKKTLDYRGKTK